MRLVCEEKKVNVAQAMVNCEELLVKIVQDKRIADEQEKQVIQAYEMYNNCTVSSFRSMQKLKELAKRQLKLIELQHKFKVNWIELCQHSKQLKKR